ncbi:MAG: tetratricopeptide repeat protein [Minicystis sp.]
MPNNLPPRHGVVVGRDPELAALDDALRRDRRVTLVSAAPARFGGTGTTALALAYAQRSILARTYPGGVFWLHAAGRPVEALARLAPDLRILGSALVREQLAEEPVDAPTDDVARVVRLALQAPREPSLLVLDDVDAEGFTDRLPLGEVRVLMTTSDDRLAFRRKLPVPPLPGPVAADLARDLGARPRDAADRLALEGLAGKELGGVPLAVDLAARYVAQAGRSWSAYATRLRTQARLTSNDRDVEAGYAPAVIAAVDVAVEAHLLGSPARRLLDGAAVFAPHAVPLGWALAAADLDPAAADAALAPLADAGLITVDPVGQTLSLHRFVHRRSRALVPMQAWIAASRRAAAGVAVWLAEGTGPARLGEVDARRPHIDEALAAADRAGADLAWVIIADRLGTYLERRARYDEARDLFERALVKAERLDPPDPGQVRVCLSNLAGLLVETGHAGEARALLERALAIDDEPTEDVPSSVRLSKLSRVLQDLGHADAARPLLERALTTSPGDEIPPAAGSSPGLPEAARVLNELRAASGAEGLLEQALHDGTGSAPDVTTILRTVEQGASAPATGDGTPPAAELTSMGLTLYALGHPGDAKPLLERALASNVAVYGPDHPEVAGDLMNLAAVLRSLGDREGARACLLRANAIAEMTLPEEDTLRKGIAARLAKV